MTCPYVGLVPYTEAERRYFFGRERETRVIASNLYGARVTILYGASGVGKSSVLRAGVLPYLEAKQNTAVVVFGDWRSPSFLKSLKNASIQAAARKHGGALQIDPSLPLDKLLIAASEAFGGTLLVILDQFEEYFLYHPADWNSFEAELACSINRTDVDAAFLISLREDGLSKLDRFDARIPNLLSNTLRLEHLGRDSAKQAIVGPLDQYRKDYGVDAGPSEIEEGLVNAVLVQVSSKENIRPALVSAGEERAHIETPLLQLVMKRLWEEERSAGSSSLRLSTLEQRLRGVENILQEHLNEVMDTLSESQKEVCTRFFGMLVTPSGTKLAQRLGDLTTWAGDLGEQVQQVLEQLSAKRILHTINPAPGDDHVSYEILHDVLARPVNAWLETRREAAEKAAAETALKVRELVYQKELENRQALIDEQRQRADAQTQLALEKGRAAARSVTVAWIIGAIAAVATASTVCAFISKKSARTAYEREQQQTTLLKKALKNFGEIPNELAAEPGNLRILGTFHERFDEKLIDLQKERLALTILDQPMVQHVLGEGFTLMQLGKSDEARFDFARILGRHSQMDLKERANEDWQMCLARAHEGIAGIFLVQGDLQAALVSYRQALTIREHWTTRRGDNEVWKAESARSHESIGTVLLEQGELVGALTAHTAALALRHELARQNPENREIRMELAWSHMYLGDVLEEQGRVEEALGRLQQAADIIPMVDDGTWILEYEAVRERLARLFSAQGRHDQAQDELHEAYECAEAMAKRERASTIWQQNIAILHNDRGDALKAAKSYRRAGEEYELACDRFASLIRKDECNNTYKRALAECYTNIGDVLLAEGMTDRARERYSEAFELRRGLIRTGSPHPALEREVAMSYQKLGDVLAAQGFYGDALPQYEEALRVRNRLAARDDSHGKLQNEVAACLEKIGDVLAKQGKYADAVTRYNEALVIRERLFERVPSNTEWRRELGQAHENVSAMLSELKDEGGAALHRARALEVRAKADQKQGR